MFDEMELNEQDSELLIDGAAGIYVPQEFAERFDMEEWHVSKEDAEALLAGPDGEYYWDAWDQVEATAYNVDESGTTWCLLQDGDLWAIRQESA